MNFFKNNQKLIISIVLSFIAVSFMILLYYKFFKKETNTHNNLDKTIDHITQIITKTSKDQMINNCTMIIEGFLKEIQKNIFQDSTNESQYNIEDLRDLLFDKKLEINFLDDSSCNVKILNGDDHNLRDFTINDSTKFKTKDLVKLLGALIGRIQYHLDKEITLIKKEQRQNPKELDSFLLGKFAALDAFLSRIELKSNNDNFQIAFSYNETLATFDYMYNKIIPDKFSSDFSKAWYTEYQKERESEKNFKIDNVNYFSKIKDFLLK